MDNTVKGQLKQLPKIDEVLHALQEENLLEEYPREILLHTCRDVVDGFRKEILKGAVVDEQLPSLFKRAKRDVKDRLASLARYRLRRVVNATGIILHTNLGRAPLCQEALQHVIDVSAGYSNLEFDLDKGERGMRYDHVKDTLCALTGAEDALIVNNNAAAVLLVLNTLSEGREAIVSRGELIEIGGEFRIPEVMEKSGAILREVGTTNRTHLSDYEKAVNEKTGLIMKVHTSNFKTVGFTEEIGLQPLVEIGNRCGVPVMNDLGSGCFIELDHFGFEREPTVQDALKTGVDVVTFSGDKLLGGPQAGIILGKKELLAQVKRNPLNRALRIDKMTLAALEATIGQYFNIERAQSRIRNLRALTETPDAVKVRAEKLLALLQGLSLKGWTFSLKAGAALAGGGSLPTQEIPTFVIAVTSDGLSAARIEKRLRALPVPVVARIIEDELLLDLKTIDESEFPFIEAGFTGLASS